MTGFSSTMPCVESIKANNPISSIIGQHVDLQRCGSELRGCCPFHADRTPSFYVNDQKGQFHCFGCGAGGDVLEFVKRYHDMTFLEACHHLDDYPLVIPFSTKHTKYDRPDRGPMVRRIWDRSSPISGTLAEKYLEGRSIPVELSNLQPNLRFGMERYDDRLTPALVVGAYDLGGDLKAIQRIFLHEEGDRVKSIAKRNLGSFEGSAVPIVGEQGPGEKGHIYLAEGVEDALSVARIMESATVWATLGTSIMTNVRLPEDCKSVTIAHDNDDPGRTAALETMSKLLRADIAVSLQSPHEFKDWNDHLVYWDQKSRSKHYNELPHRMELELVMDEYDLAGEDYDV